jgi:hypothetical protein
MNSIISRETQETVERMTTVEIEHRNCQLSISEDDTTRNRIERAAKAEEVSKELGNHLSLFLEEDWRIIRNPAMNLKKLMSMLSTPNFAITGRAKAMTRVKAFRFIFGDALGIIREIINRNMGENWSVNCSSSAKYARRIVNDKEATIFYAILTMITTMRGPSSGSAYENFKDLSNVPMGWQRFRTLLSAFEPSDDEFSRLEEVLRESF